MKNNTTPVLTTTEAVRQEIEAFFGSSPAGVQRTWRFPGSFTWVTCWVMCRVRPETLLPEIQTLFYVARSSATRTRAFVSPKEAARAAVR